MKSYPEYRDSTIDWIDSIPKHWRVLRNFAIFSDRSDRGYPHLPPFSVTQREGVIPQEYSSDQIVRSSSRTENGKRICKGDMVYNKMRMWQGAVGIAPAEGRVSTAYVVCQPIRDLIPRYFEFLYRTPLYMAQSLRNSYGGCKDQYCLYPKDFKNIYTIFPPKEEQTQTANFLDHKTQQIDDLISVKERKIELLQEYRASLINKAVTKGLDPNVEMQPSGLEWITEVPKHWEVLKVKHVSSCNPSKNNPRTKSFNDEPVVFLPMERVHTDGTIDQALKLPYSQLKAGYTYFEENDVLVAKVTPCFENGKIVLIKDLATPVGFGSTEFIVIRPNVEKVFPLFLYYVLYNYPLRSIGKHFMTSAVGLKRVPTEFVKNFQIPIPSYQEQMHIVNFLDHKTKQIDELRSNEEQTIKLLKEYRQSLISAVVTGKIDVRNEV